MRISVGSGRVKGKIGRDPQIAVRLPPPMLAVVRAEGERRGVSGQTVIREALARFLADGAYQFPAGPPENIAA